MFGSTERGCHSLAPAGHAADHPDMSPVTSHAWRLGPAPYRISRDNRGQRS